MESNQQTFDSLRARAFAKGTVPDGYHGARRKVLFSLREDHKVMAISDNGWYWSGLVAADVNEAVWMLTHNPRHAAVIIDLTHTRCSECGQWTEAHAYQGELVMCETCTDIKMMYQDG